MTTTTKPTTTTAAALATIDAAKAAIKRTAAYARWTELDRQIGHAITLRDKARSAKRTREDGAPAQSRAIAKHQATIDALLGLTRLFGRVHGLYPEAPGAT